MKIVRESINLLKPKSYEDIRDNLLKLDPLERIDIIFKYFRKKILIRGNKNFNSYILNKLLIDSMYELEPLKRIKRIIKHASEYKNIERIPNLSELNKLIVESLLDPSLSMDDFKQIFFGKHKYFSLFRLKKILGEKANQIEFLTDEYIIANYPYIEDLLTHAINIKDTKFIDKILKTKNNIILNNTMLFAIYYNFKNDTSFLKKIFSKLNLKDYKLKGTSHTKKDILPVLFFIRNKIGSNFEILSDTYLLNNFPHRNLLLKSIRYKDDKLLNKIIKMEKFKITPSLISNIILQSKNDPTILNKINSKKNNEMNIVRESINLLKPKSNEEIKTQFLKLEPLERIKYILKYYRKILIENKNFNSSLFGEIIIDSINKLKPIQRIKYILNYYLIENIPPLPELNKILLETLLDPGLSLNDLKVIFFRKNISSYLNSYKALFKIKELLGEKANHIRFLTDDYIINNYDNKEELLNSAIMLSSYSPA